MQLRNFIELRQKYYSVLTKDVVKEMQWRYYKKDVFLKEWYVIPSKKYKDILLKRCIISECFIYCRPFT